MLIRENKQQKENIRTSSIDQLFSLAFVWGFDSNHNVRKAKPPPEHQGKGNVLITGR